MIAPHGKKAGLLRNGKNARETIKGTKSDRLARRVYGREIRQDTVVGQRRNGSTGNKETSPDDLARGNCAARTAQGAGAVKSNLPARRGERRVSNRAANAPRITAGEFSTNESGLGRRQV